MDLASLTNIKEDGSSACPSDLMNIVLLLEFTVKWAIYVCICVGYRCRYVHISSYFLFILLIAYIHNCLMHIHTIKSSST